jgi:hypothetical protein
MKGDLGEHRLPSGALFITCSSHEERCLGVLQATSAWTPQRAILFHYDDDNARRELHHAKMLTELEQRYANTRVLQFTESSAVLSLRENIGTLRGALGSGEPPPIVLDISVFTKRHLLMMLHWLDDEGAWDRLTIVYSEPEEYDVSPFIPLSFGLSSFHQIPGFSASPDMSRPVHLALFLGYEGDRALAVYEHVEPMYTTLFVADPPYRPEWRGRTEELNADLLALNGPSQLRHVDGLDPDATTDALSGLFGSQAADSANLICPLGTKPQTLGVYTYLRMAPEPAAILYASPLRHNHEFYSHGIGGAWVLKQGGN